MKTLMKKLLVVLTVTLMMFPSIVVADPFPVNIPDFARDPSGKQFQIVPVDPSNLPPEYNLAGPPTLTYGMTSEPDGTENTLMMQWDPIDPEQESAAGWGIGLGRRPGHS